MKMSEEIIEIEEMVDDYTMEEPKYMKDVIYENRKKKQLTQEQLADLLNVSNKTISKWERGIGYPDVTLIPLLAKSLDITINDLFDVKDTISTKAGENGNTKENLIKYKISMLRAFIILIAALFIPVFIILFVHRRNFINISYFLGAILFCISLVLSIYKSMVFYFYCNNKTENTIELITLKNYFFSYTLVIYLLVTSLLMFVYNHSIRIPISSLLYLIFAIIPYLIVNKFKIEIFSNHKKLILGISLIIFIFGIISIFVINEFSYFLFYVTSQIINYAIIFLSNNFKK